VERTIQEWISRIDRSDLESKVKSFLETSANPVKTQIWTALIAML